MNVNAYAKKGLEWTAVLAVGFLGGSWHVAGTVYDANAFAAPEWIQEVAAYDVKVALIVAICATLWIGLDWMGETNE